MAGRWDDIKGGVWSKPGATTKQKSVHTVPLTAPARHLLAAIQKQVPAESEWVFPGIDGDHRRDVKDAWAAIRRAAKIEDVRVHDLRHTYASVLASAGKSLPVIGALLGHTTPVTTARYSHLFDTPLRDATEEAAAIITGAPTAEVVPLPERRHG